MCPFKILVVDDFEEFRRFVFSMLQPRPEFQLTEASAGLEAVQKAEELQPDLLLLDIGLPKLDGLEVARRVRKLAPAAKILFLSQESSLDIVREALRLGVGYICKRSTQSDLLPAIEAVLQGKRFVSRSLGLSDGPEAKPSSTHEMLFCSDEVALLAGLTRFIADALNAGNPAVVWATESHQQRLLQRLRLRGVDIDAAIQRGTYITLDADQPSDPARLVEIIRDLGAAASKAGKEHPRVAAFSERSGRLWAAGETDEAMRMEQFGNELVSNYVVDILCAYPLPQGLEDEDALKSICAIHTRVSRL